MHNDIDPTPLKFFDKLRELSPSLHHICGLAIGMAAALAIYKVLIKDADKTEIVGLIALGVLLYAIGVLFKFFTETPRRRKLFSAAVVVLACVLYGAINLKTTFQDTAGPTAPTQPTWCVLIPGTCDTGQSFSEPVMLVEELDFNTVSPIGDNQVYFQFAGSLSRENDIVPFLNRLSADGWNGQGFARGGERTPAAYGLNVVRYFYPEDRENALRLVNAIIEANPPRGTGANIGIQGLTAESFDKVPAVGTLEIWMSN